MAPFPTPVSTSGNTVFPFPSVTLVALVVSPFITQCKCAELPFPAPGPDDASGSVMTTVNVVEANALSRARVGATSVSA
jgi:hypothetical protein